MHLKKHIESMILEINNNKNLISEEVIKNTPERIETFYKEIFSGLNIDPYTFLERKFPVKNNDLVLEKNITFYSMCEHHFLPFFGKISIGYIPNGEIVGFGDIIKVIETYCKRPQLQERLCEEIAETLFKGLKCQGVYVLMEAEHTCMTMRGVKAIGSKVITTSSKGVFNTQDNLKIEFLNLIKL
ncbi:MULTISPECIES: GTP cyclohydrolase I FolE [Cetobacterium]|jgi:GTP cyclohydrolase I|uniref:GTP cyclohydrolase 1 n=1 Tax=Candidatus Cetobacterium colombiensis TaxID=3073100 RepID=A0ABU4W899_9FUSO|nr:GTP cyclohydrolase I FolE [Candidatus Cetobacterium colombiensis]MDX8335747.1 GTP cyclohydrolase I FolE [Candidatus Cetobacterium colombiensis]